MKAITEVLRTSALALSVCSGFAISAQAQQNSEQSKVIVDQDGTVHVPAYEMPLSIYMSDGGKRAYINQSLHSPSVGVPEDVSRTRQSMDRIFHAPLLEKANAVYPANIEAKKYASVPIYVVTPKDGLAGENKCRVLINLHGGGGILGAGPIQLVESIPIASTAKMTVISVNYRLAPEHRFPAPIDDVVSVYKELLKHYASEDIGIYGLSVGGGFTAMAVARFQNEKLPRPGAIGLLSAASAKSGGDSRYKAPALEPLFGSNSTPPPASPNPPAAPWPEGYFGDTSLQDPLVSPSLHPEVLARFRPTLLITGTRDFLASSMIDLHRQLVKADVDAELHFWDGMWHGFTLDVDIPESKEVYEVVAKFFHAHLGKPNCGSQRLH